MLEGLPDWLTGLDWTLIASQALRVLAIIVIAFVAVRLSRFVLVRFERRIVEATREEEESESGAQRRARTLCGLLHQAARLAIWIAAFVMVLGQLGVAIGPLVAGAGIAGLAVGFGAQNLVRDVISGFFIILENQIRVGDVAVLNGTGGVVESVNFRTTVLRDMAGTVHVFPNGAISTLANQTKDWSAAVLDINVAYKEDADRAAGIMKRVGDEIQADGYFRRLIANEIEVFGVNELGNSAVVIKARIKTRPGKQWEIGREYRRRIKQAFDAEGIEIPFPHTTLYFGEASPPILTRTAGAGDDRGV